MAGGLLISKTSIWFAFVFLFILKIEPNNNLFLFFNFVSRAETFIPLGTLFFGSVVGFIDDVLVTMEGGGNYIGGGLKLSHRLGFVSILSLLIGLWFHFKLDLHSLSFFGWVIDLESFAWTLNLDNLGVWNISFGFLIIFITLFTLLSAWGTGIIDGFDGLAAGVFIPVYLCFAALAFSRGFYDIATLLMVIAGSTMAYLWYNIPPAKFYMGDTGTVGLLLTIAVVAILIDFLYILPIAGFILYITEFSAVIQVLSKKIFKKKIILAAPLHHHLEAIGWKRNQITMRYWLVSIMTSTLGLAIGLLFG